MTTPVLDAILKRRSIREFTDQTVTTAELHEIIRAGIWAPSGLNNQPWRFVIVTAPDRKDLLAEQTHYSDIVRSAAALIAVYLEKDAMYDPVKDYQSAGACIQNMLLAIEALNLGGVWLGQILKQKDAVAQILDVPPNLDLMAVVALGHPRHRNQKSRRKELSQFIIKEV